jgi:hypothetical protein
MLGAARFSLSPSGPAFLVNYHAREMEAVFQDSRAKFQAVQLPAFWLTAEVTKTIKYCDSLAPACRAGIR